MQINNYSQTALLQHVQSVTSRSIWELQAQQAAAEVTSNPYKTLFSRRYRPQLIITVLVRFLQRPAAKHLVLHVMC